jgi:hypothetical protein
LNVTQIQAPDGFRGTYDEVLAYEKKFGFMDGNHDDNAQKQSAGMVYEASDGFCGTYEEVLTHEKTVPTRAGDVANDTGKDSYLYKCSDGYATSRACVSVVKGSEDQCKSATIIE